MGVKKMDERKIDNGGQRCDLCDAKPHHAPDLQRSMPSLEGVDARAIERFVDAVQGTRGLEMHGLVVLRHGKVIAETSFAPYVATQPTTLFSLSKSFTSTAIGFLVQEGKVRLDERVIDILKDDAPKEPGVLWDELTVHNVLSMNTGHGEEPEIFDGKKDLARRFFDHPLVYAPGSHFLYNTAATYMLSAIVQARTGSRLLDYLTPRLFAPLGIEGAFWQQSADGIDTGGFGLMLRPMDIAKFGQFCLNKGVWQGERLLDAAWFDRAFATHSDNAATGGQLDWGSGYGYQFWHCQPHCWRGDGAFGQYCVMIPEKDAVVAITSGVTDMQAVLTHMWRELLPGLDAAGDADADAALEAKLAAASYAAPTGVDATDAEKGLDGRTLQTRPGSGIEWMKLSFSADACDAVLSMAGEQRRLRFGRGRWASGMYNAEGFAAMRPDGLSPVALAFAWEDSRTLVLTMRQLDAPFVVRWRVVAENGRFALAQQLNVGFGPTEMDYQGNIV